MGRDESGPAEPCLGTLLSAALNSSPFPVLPLGELNDSEVPILSEVCF